MKLYRVVKLRSIELVLIVTVFHLLGAIEGLILGYRHCQ